MAIIKIFIKAGEYIVNVDKFLRTFNIQDLEVVPIGTAKSISKQEAFNALLQVDRFKDVLTYRLLFSYLEACEPHVEKLQKIINITVPSFSSFVKHKTTIPADVLPLLVARAREIKLKELV